MVLNRLFERQPTLLTLLGTHAGRTFVWRAAPVEAAMTIGHDGRLSVADPAVVPDVVLTIDTVKLWADGWRPGQPLPERAGIVHVSGDAALAQTLSTLAKSWRPDVEDLLAQYVGDVAAVQLVAGAKRLVGLASQFVSRSSQNLAEYATHETHLLTARESLQEHTQEVARLNQDLDRLEERVREFDERLRGFDAGGQP